MKKYLLLLILILIFSVSFIIGDAQNPKYWVNTWTEVKEFEDSKFGATIHTGHKVFLDKTDGLYKKHKLTDERPAKDYILIQSAKCCVEIYPYYVKYYDVNHEEVRLYEERWVVQRLFKTPDKWKDVGAWNPIMVVEEYSEPAGDVIKVTITYDTDYGELVVEYFQRDGNALKHNVTFKNTSDSTETFRVLQRWAGIVGSKCNGEDTPLIEDVTFLAFHDSDKPKKKFNIAENLYSMVFNEDGSEKTDQCLQRPISIETHAQGMKSDFIYGNWVLAQNESLIIDPDTATLDNPTEDGYINWNGGYVRHNTDELLSMGFLVIFIYRSYVEWDVSGIPNGADVTDTVFKYNGLDNNIDCHIHEMVGKQPSVESDADVFAEIGEGTVYAAPAGFPVAGTNKSVDLGTSADSDLESQLSVGWFAIGIQADDEGGQMSNIWAEEYAATPDPTLYVEYSIPAEVNVIFFSTPF